jgi:hypothetical protein
LITVHGQQLAPVSASIEAENPVTLAGLRRVAALVGISEAEDVRQGDLTLRSVNGGSPHSGIDVSCSESDVVITLSVRPSPELWLLILDIVGCLVPVEPPTAGR